MAEAVPSWVPAFFQVTRKDNEYISGIVQSEEDAERLLHIHLRATLTSFVTWSEHKKEAGKVRHVWQVEDYDENTPLSISRRVVLACQHGRAPQRTPKKEHLQEHVYTKKRVRVQEGKKLDCPAKLFIRYVTRYDTFSVKGDATARRKEKTMKNLKKSLLTDSPPTSTFIHFKIPLLHVHNHATGHGACFLRSLQDGGGERIVNGGERALERGEVGVKSAQCTMRGTLKKLVDASYLCNDMETLQRMNVALDNIRQTLEQQCQKANGPLLNTPAEIVMLRKDLRVLPVKKTKSRLSKECKWNQDMKPGTCSTT